VGFIYLQDLRDWLAFMAGQLASLGLFAAALFFTGMAFDLDVLLAAVFAGSVSATAGLMAMMRGRLAWASASGFLLGPAAGAVMLLPVLMLRIGPFEAFARASLLFLIVLSAVHAILTPQLVAWFAAWQPRKLRPKISSPSDGDTGQN
jgi:hypothetical protein